VRGAVSLPTLLAGVLGLALVGVGVVYLVVECQALPGFLGRTPGDTAPRTGLGIAGVSLGLAVLAFALLAARREPPSGRPRR
jgi:hypothetical protein